MALVEGQIAGLAAADRGRSSQTVRRARKARRFARLLDRTFRSRPELKRLAMPRDYRVPVRRRSVLAAAGASLVARCEIADALRNGSMPGKNMRPGDAVSFHWNPDSVRPPVFPVRVESLADCRSRLSQNQPSYRRLSMNWKGVMPAITTCFQQRSQHRSWLHDGTLPLASGQRLHGHRRPRIAGRRRNAVVRREAWHPAHLCQSGSGTRAGGGGDLGAFDFRSGRAGEGGCGSGLRWPDGVCLLMCTRETGAK